MSREAEFALNAPTTTQDATTYVDDIPVISASQLALNDIADGFKKWRLCLMLAYHDIKLRYRRSVLGPFWITLSMAITVYSMGYLYGHLFHIELQTYYPYLVTSMLIWTLISTLLNELTDVFMSYEGLIKEIKLPYTLYLHRVIARNFIIFLHNMLVLIPIYIIFHHTTHINLNSILALPGLAVLYFNALTYGTVLAIIGSRFRDVSQIIKSLVQVIFFLTPVMWSPMIINESKRYLVNFNPFYSFLELVRAPLLGTYPTMLNISVCAGITVIGLLLSFKMFVPYRSRIVYWV